MFEIYWSNFYDAYIIRSIDCNSSIPPVFIGTREACDAALHNYRPYLIA